MNTDNNQNTDTNDRRNAVICACCLTLFPVIYFVGTTVRYYLG